MCTKSMQEITIGIRKDIVKIACIGKDRHIASAMSVVEIISVLYFDIMKYNPKNPKCLDRDRFILSKGHACLALYSVLYKAGFFDNEYLRMFSRKGSPIGGHPTINIPGVEATTGSLGHGLSLGVGMAIAAKIDEKDYKTFVLLGDGECQEGSIWEAFTTIKQYNLVNLITIIDHNKLQASDKINHPYNVMSTMNLKDRLESFGFNVLEVSGHDTNEIKSSILYCYNSNKPTVIIANTIKGKGLSCMEGKRDWHSRFPTESEFETILDDLSMLREEIEI